MAALTAARNTKAYQGEAPLPVKLGLPLAAGAKVFKGGMAMLDAGWLKAAATAVGKQVIGRVNPKDGAMVVDNTAGGNGALTTDVEQGVFQWGNSAAGDAIAQANVGSLCYCVDDQTVALTSGGATRSIAGTIVAVDAKGVWVFQALAQPIDGAALAADIANLAALIVDLASVAAGKGSALIGIEDAGGFYAGATVEAALQETIGGKRIANVADGNLVGGVPVVHKLVLADAAGDTDFVIAEKTEITDVTVVKIGGAGMAGNTVKLTNVAGGGDITDAMALTGADQTVSRAGTINDAQDTILAGGTLRLTVAKAGANAACVVYVRGIKRA